MNKTNAMILGGILLFGGYFLWHVFVNDRYQALCNISYWQATSEQRDACKDMKTELDNR
jgi:hypothetical protein